MSVPGVMLIFHYSAFYVKSSANAFINWFLPPQKNPKKTKTNPNTKKPQTNQNQKNPPNNAPHPQKNPKKQKKQPPQKNNIQPKIK